MNKLSEKLKAEDSLAIRSRVNALLDERGLSAAELIRRIGMTSGGHHKMWKNGTLSVARALAIAEVLEVHADRILTGEQRSVTASDP